MSGVLGFGEGEGLRVGCCVGVELGVGFVEVVGETGGFVGASVGVGEMFEGLAVGLGLGVAVGLGL